MNRRDALKLIPAVAMFGVAMPEPEPPILRTVELPFSCRVVSIEPTMPAGSYCVTVEYTYDDYKSAHRLKATWLDL